MANTFIHKHYEKVILAGLLLLFSGLLYLQLSVVQESQAKKVDGIVNAVEPPADFQKTDYTEKKYSKEVLFDENVLVWNNLWDGDENPYSQSEYSVNIDMMVPQQLALCKHDSHLTYAGYYPKKDSKTTGKCLIEKCGKILEAPKNEVAKALEEEKIDNDINKNGIPDDWEKSHGFEVVEVADGATTPIADTDGDGFNDKEEFLAGTGPRDPGSHPLFVTKLSFDSEKKIEDVPFENLINEKLANVKEVGEVTDFKLEECSGSENSSVLFSCKRVANGKPFRMKRCRKGKEILYKNAGSTGENPSIGFKVDEIGAEIVNSEGKDGKVKSQRKVWVKIVSVKNPADKFTCYLGERVLTGRKSIPLACTVANGEFWIKSGDTKSASAEFKIGDEITLASDYSIEKYSVSELKGTEQEPVLVLTDGQGKTFEIKAQSPAAEAEEEQESAK